MRVRRLDGQDWTFGRGLADYIKDDAAIAQNVKTRLQSFKNDWFIDIEAGIDWLNILGQRGTENIILNEVSRTILGTAGVIKINALDYTIDSRRVIISASISTIFNTEINITTDVTV